MNDFLNAFFFSGFAALIFFYRHLARTRRSAGFWIAIACLLLFVPIQVATELLNLHMLREPIAILVILPPLVWLIPFVSRRHKGHISDTASIGFAVLLWFADVAYEYGNVILSTYTHFHIPYQVHLGWLTLDTNIMTDAVLTGWILVALVNRFARTLREQSRTETELQSAREVQHLLVPEQLPTFQNFQIETSYLPAREVSGDFYQALSLPGNGLLVVLGDAAGKGMGAALTVSVLVGAVRALLERVKGPAAILAALNQVLSEQKMGLTTCLALAIDSEGRCRLASAGHPAPYLNGREIAMNGELPLGFSNDVPYEEQSFQLQAGDRLLLLTDGVPEAMNKEHLLFGWERAQLLSARPAQELAVAAQHFGQNDDITVVGITYIGLVV